MVKDNQNVKGIEIDVEDVGSSYFETLHIASDVAQAQLVVAFLNAYNINSFIPDEMTSSLMWHYNVAIGGVRVQVRSQDRERAVILLKEYNKQIEPGEEGAERGEGLETHNNDADLLANKAWRTSLVGFLLLPPLLHILSFIWALGALKQRKSLSRLGLIMAYRALTLSLIALLLGPLIVFYLLML